MPTRWFHAFLSLLGHTYATRHDPQIRFLKLQVELLKARIPGNHVILTPEERIWLIKIGAGLDHGVSDLLDIVAPKTYRRWLREQDANRTIGRVGRPRKRPPLR